MYSPRQPEKPSQVPKRSFKFSRPVAGQGLHPAFTPATAAVRKTAKSFMIPVDIWKEIEWDIISANMKSMFIAEVTLFVIWLVKITQSVGLRFWRLSALGTKHSHCWVSTTYSTAAPVLSSFDFIYLQKLWIRLSDGRLCFIFYERSAAGGRRLLLTP